MFESIAACEVHCLSLSLTKDGFLSLSKWHILVGLYHSIFIIILFDFWLSDKFMQCLIELNFQLQIFVLWRMIEATAITISFLLWELLKTKEGLLIVCLSEWFVWKWCWSSWRDSIKLLWSCNTLAQKIILWVIISKSLRSSKIVSDVRIKLTRWILDISSVTLDLVWF